MRPCGTVQWKTNKLQYIIVRMSFKDYQAHTLTLPLQTTQELNLQSYQ